MQTRTPKSSTTKFFFFLLASLVVLELLSKGVVYFGLGIEDGHYASYYENDPKLRMLTWTQHYSPHPYFGYESPTTRASEKLLSEVRDDDFVVGILGGSVAESFAWYAIRNPTHFESLRKVLPAFGNKNLQIVNLANGGYKQPQQFFVAAYFMDKLDLVINIDGFNDASPIHFLPVYPLDFPVLSSRFYERANQGGMYANIGRTARWVYLNMRRAPLSWKFPGLSRSSGYFLTWHYLSDILYRVVKASESAYYANEFAAYQSDAVRKASPKEFSQKLIELWKKYTVLEDDMVRKRTGKPVFFFLQPNQYLKDSKPFSEQEKRIAIDPLRLESTNEMMVLLKMAAQDLGRSKVPIFDLTGVFANTQDTVYKDDCCHLNALGNQIMADAIVSRIMRFQAGGVR